MIARLLGTIMPRIMQGKILIADDEAKIVSLVSAYLEKDGFTAVHARDGGDALKKFRQESPDCVILDIGMPGLDGIEVAREIRKSSSVPIIFLTARTEETDRILGLEMGADDYVVKPFSPRELTARVRAVLRRTRQIAVETSIKSGTEDSKFGILKAGGILLDPVRHEVLVAGKQVYLTALQFAILATLMSAPGRVFGRLKLLEAAVGTNFEGYERTVDAHIKNLRKALGDDGESAKYIGTIRGVGYKFLDQENEA